MSDSADKGSTTSLILPFATPAPSRLKDFTKNMELAAILYLAESSREKGEGRILRKAGEKLVFVTETYYPLWLIPHNGATLVFDGLGTTSHTLYYDTMPDTKIFDKSILENQKTIEAYDAALAGNSDYFRNFIGKEENKIEGLITNPDLTKDLLTYLSQLKENREPLTTKAVLIPTLDDREIQACIEQLSDLKEKNSKDLENISTSMRLLNAATMQVTKKIGEEIRKSQEEHHRQNERIKPSVTRTIRQIQSKYHRITIRKSKMFKKRLQLLHKNQVRLQKTLRHLRTEAKQCETRIQSSKRRKKKRAENQWTLKLKRIKKKLPTLQNELEDTVKRVQNIETAQRVELAHLKAECDMRIEAADKPIRDLQAAYEAEVALKRQEIATLKDITSNIANQLHELSKAKKVTLEEFHKITMSRKERTCELVYMPFYLVRYERDDRKRYVAYPPSIVNDMGILTQMKGALGAAKMKALLQSRSKAIATFLNQLVTLIEGNPILEKEITEAAIQESVLLEKRLRISVKKGLEELESENWISEHELQALSKVLYIYS